MRATFRIKARGRMHVGVDQASVYIALGLDHFGIRQRCCGVGRLVAFMWQRQTSGRKRCSRTLRRYRLLTADMVSRSGAPGIPEVSTDRWVRRPRYAAFQSCGLPMVSDDGRSMRV
jgi:hypothetical protein